MRLHLTLLLAALGVAACGCGAGTTPQLEVGAPAPTFQLASAADGRLVGIETLKGHIGIVHFWSTSCSVCLQEIEDLKEIHRLGKAKILSIALDESTERVQELVRAREIEYPVLMGNQDTFEQFDGYSIPYTIVLDHSQTVRKRFFGRMSREDLERVIRAASPTEGVALLDRS